MVHVDKISENMQAELEKSNQRLELLSYITGKLLTSDRPHQVIEDLCLKVLAALDCHTFFNYLVDEDKQGLFLNAWAGIPDETSHEIQWLDYGDTVCGCAARDGCRIVCENIPETFDQRTELVKSLGIKAYACHPLFSQGKVLGTLSFGTRSRLRFEDDDLALMKIVSEHVAIAIERENSHLELEHQVKERTAELEEANRTLVAKIEERRLAEEALRAERQKFNDILDMLPAYVVLLTSDYHVPFVNHLFKERFGDSGERRCFEYLFNRNEPCEVCETYTVLKTMKPHHWEWTGPDSRNYDIFDFPFTNTDGSLLIMEVGIDITDHKQAQVALAASEASYRELTESIDDLFYAMDRDLRYTYWNKASEAITGIMAKDAIGKSLYEVFPDIKGTRAEQFYIKSLHKQQPERLESEFHAGENKYIFEINAYPTENGLSVIAKDITDKKKLEVHLSRARRMESIGTFASVIAHDLNNVLTPILLSQQILKEKFKDEHSQKLLDILEKNSQHGADLIKQVLSFARGIEGERVPVQVNQIISEIVKAAKETFPENIEIKYDLSRELHTISGDSTQLHQVIMNLCTNARDAMPEGGVLNISSENYFIDENYARMHAEAKVGNYIKIEVSDTGIGIPPRILDRIFEPFFTTKEFGKGTGLGLSTSHSILKSHGGYINVYSEVGAGTKFTAYLPAIRSQVQKYEDEQSELPIGHEELILIVEDESSIREITSTTLETYGYKVITAKDGAEAVELYVQNKDKIKVILMDMMMPIMDGYGSIQAIKKIDPEAKIIAVSGLPEKDKFSAIGTSYATAFMPKPYTAERLLKTIHKTINEGI